MRFSLRTIMSGAPSSNNLFSRLLRFITRRYRSLRSEVAKRPPSNWTIGLNSGGITGITSSIIHSGRLPDLRNASTTSRRRVARMRRWPEVSLISLRKLSACDSRSISSSSFLIASAPIPALNPFWYFSRYSRYSLSLSSCFLAKGVSPGSITIYAAKYSTRSRIRGDISSIRPIRLGMPLKYHICETEAANSIWPIRSRRTLARVTSTPQRSHTIPL